MSSASTHIRVSDKCFALCGSLQQTTQREVSAPPPPAPTPVADNLAEAGIERHDPNKWTSAATRHLDRLVFARGDRMHCSWAVVADALNEMVGRQAEGEPPGTMILAEPVSPTQVLVCSWARFS